MKALIIGATGAVGKDLVTQLLTDKDFDEVHIFVRRSVSLGHAKLHVHVVDYDDICSWSSDLTGDVLFSAMGTTLKQAGSKEAQWKIDYDYQYDVAKAARDNGVKTLVLVSAMNANAKSSFFYPRMKGELEEAIQALGYPRTIIMRPPSLIRKNTDRPLETVSIKILNFLNSIGLFKGMAPQKTEQVANAMIVAAKDGKDGIRIFEPRMIAGQNFGQ